MSTPESRPVAQQTTAALDTRRFSRRALLIGGLGMLVVVAIGLLTLRSADAHDSISPTGGASALALAPAAFLAGMLSFLSPCCLPVLSAYFAYTVQAGRERMILTTFAFFLGVATTMVILGASATALSQLLFRNLSTLTVVGGLLVIGFGVMNLLGKGFGGIQLLDRPRAGNAGAYVFGATFALGWTACVGPILGALLTMLATQGLAVAQGAVLAFIYTLGLGMPLIALAIYLSRLDTHAPLWRFMRGRGFTLNLGFTTLYLHTTSIASGVLLIPMGVLLATGQLATLSRWAAQMPLTQWVLRLDEGIRQIFVGG
ncbi:MAG: cytochrome c biogenesis protein CcdA [Roseiflexaceae bacterium]